jgi:hypothetical protein
MEATLITKTTYYKENGIEKQMPINLDTDYILVENYLKAEYIYNKMVEEEVENNGGEMETIMYGAKNVTKVTHGASYTIFTMQSKEML